MIQVLSCSEVEKQKMTDQANVVPILRKRNENDIRINFAIGITTVTSTMGRLRYYRHAGNYEISTNQLFHFRQSPHRFIIQFVLSFSRVIFFALPYCSAITIQRKKHYIYYVNIKENKQTY